MLGWWWWLRQLRQPQQQQQQQQINCNNNKKNNIKWPAFRWGVSIKRPNSSLSHPSLCAPASASFPNFSWLELSPFVSHSAIKQPTSGCRSKIFRWSRLCPLENWTQTHTHTNKAVYYVYKMLPFFYFFVIFFLFIAITAIWHLCLARRFLVFFFSVFFFLLVQAVPMMLQNLVCLFVCLMPMTSVSPLLVVSCLLLVFHLCWHKHSNTIRQAVHSVHLGCHTCRMSNAVASNRTHTHMHTNVPQLCRYTKAAIENHFQLTSMHTNCLSYIFLSSALTLRKTCCPVAKLARCLVAKLPRCLVASLPCCLFGRLPCEPKPKAKWMIVASRVGSGAQAKHELQMP